MDRAKQARGWLKGSNFDPIPSANLNSEGALASLPGGETAAKFLFASFRDGGGTHVNPQPDRSGRYRLTFTGAATVNFASAGTNVTQIDANTYEFDCNYVGTKWLTFTPTSFPIKATIVKTTDLAAHAGGQIFRQEYLDFLPSGGCFRFMDWAGTNNSPVVNLADYPVAESQSWLRVPLSVMVSLCNTKSADMWLNIPHQATDALVTDWATYLRDNLTSTLKIRIELSNEIWNTGTFSQGSYFKGQAEAVWGVPDGYGGGGYWLDYAGKRFAQIMAIFNTVFTGQTNRLIGVIAGQAANPVISARMLDATAWQTFEPGSYVAPHTRAKEYSIADYIGWGGNGGAIAQANIIKTALDTSHAAAVQAIKDQFPFGLAGSKNGIDMAVPLAANRGLRLTTYEYNNHYDLAAVSGSNLWSGGAPVAGALDAFIEATYSAEMAAAQDELRNYWKAQNGSLKCFFVECVRGGRSGTWGGVTHIGHDSAIWNALTAWHTANARWWAR